MRSKNTEKVASEESREGGSDAAVWGENIPNRKWQVWQFSAGGLLYLGNHKGTSVAKATWVRDGVRKVAKTRTWVTLLAVVGTCLVSTLREGCVEVTSPDANGKRISWAAVWKME